MRRTSLSGRSPRAGTSETRRINADPPIVVVRAKKHHGRLQNAEGIRLIPRLRVPLAAVVDGAMQCLDVGLFRPGRTAPEGASHARIRCLYGIEKVSPPDRVMNEAKMKASTVSLMKRHEPSHTRNWAPPGWKA